jgi:predicted ferric reductase
LTARPSARQAPAHVRERRAPTQRTSHRAGQQPARRIAAGGPPRRWWADVAGSAALLSVVVVVALWLANKGVQNAAGSGGLATTTGRLTGLLSADFMLLQVLLMARIPWVERSYGQDALARRHRLLGFVSFWLMIAHVVLITFGYAQSSGHGVIGQGWDLVVNYPGMLLATAGTALLIAVVALSIRAARRRLRYESWHLIHLYAYLGVGLALPHQIWTGAEFTSSPAARAYWWTLYCATLGAVLLFRIGLPAWRTLYHRIEVESVVRESPTVVSVYLRGHRLDRLPVRAGQFFLWRFLDGPGWSRANPYSLSAVPHTRMLRITVKDLGDGSARVASLKPGTKVLVEGPYGAMTAARRQRPKVLLLAAGVGITAMRALIEDLDYAPGDATLVYRVGRQSEAVFAAELAEIAQARGVRLYLLDGGRAPHPSWLPAQYAHLGDVAAIRGMAPDVAEHEVYLCGPPDWMDSVRGTLREAGVPSEHVHAEEFAW